MIVFMLLGQSTSCSTTASSSGAVARCSVTSGARYFLVVVAVAVGLVAIGTGLGGAADRPDFRHVVFNVVSLVTTTGYATSDFEAWPSLAQLVLLDCWRWARWRARRAAASRASVRCSCCRPYAASSPPQGTATRSGLVHYGGKPVPDDVMSGVWVFLIVYFALRRDGGPGRGGGLRPGDGARRADRVATWAWPRCHRPERPLRPLPGPREARLLVLHDRRPTELFTLLVLLSPGFGGAERRSARGGRPDEGLESPSQGDTAARTTPRTGRGRPVSKGERARMSRPGGATRSGPDRAPEADRHGHDDPDPGPTRRREAPAARRDPARPGLAALAMAIGSRRSPRPPRPRRCDPKEAGFPLRIVAYVLHPVGVTIDYLLLRPAYWIGSHEPFRLFGRED